MTPVDPQEEDWKRGKSMEIHWSHVEELSEDERQAIEVRLAALAQGHTDLIDLRIVGRGSGPHRHGGKEIRVNCQARQRDYRCAAPRMHWVSRSTRQSMPSSEVRKLREIRSTHRDERPQNPYLGIVDCMLQAGGYGFIVTDGGERGLFPSQRRAWRS
jgi:hypothetical protein